MDEQTGVQTVTCQTIVAEWNKMCEIWSHIFFNNNTEEVLCVYNEKQTFTTSTDVEAIKDAVQYGISIWNSS